MSEDVLEFTPDEPTSDKEWFGYKYLGPGTDVYGKVSRGIQPVDGLDAAAMKHDLAYYNIAQKYKRGLISKRDALDAIDKADLKLWYRSGFNSMKSLPAAGWKLIKGDPIGAIETGLKGVPAQYTGAAMLAKVLLSKLGIKRGWFSGIRRKK